jgi:hypothetical protein
MKKKGEKKNLEQERKFKFRTRNKVQETRKII